MNALKFGFAGLLIAAFFFVLFIGGSALAFVIGRWSAKILGWY